MESLMDELDTFFATFDKRVTECQLVQAEVFRKLTEHEVDQQVNTTEERLNQARQDLINETNDKMVQDLARSAQLAKLKLASEPNVDIAAKKLSALTEPTSNIESISHNLLFDLRYKNAPNIAKKVPQLELFNLLTRVELPGRFASMIPLARNRIFAFDFDSNVMTMLDAKGRVLCERKGLGGRTYKLFKACGRHIVANGVFEDSSPYENRKQTFLDVYDCNLNLKATKKFRLFTEISLGSVDLANRDMFMYMALCNGKRKCTVYDYSLNVIHSFMENTVERDEPYFFDGERIQFFTKRHLFIYSHSPKVLPKNHMRMLDLFTGLEIARVQMDNPRIYTKFLFDPSTEPVQVLNYNKQRRSLQVISLPEDRLVAENTSSDDLFNNLEYLTGITEDYELFFIDLNKKKLIFI